MSLVELLVYVWAACKYFVFTVQGPGTTVSVSFCCLCSFLFFVLLYECIALPSVFEQLLYSKSLCEVFFLPPCLLSIFFTPPSEEFRFPVHAWVCRYYTYVRVSSMYIQWDSQFCCIDKHLCTYMCMCSGGFRLILLFLCSLIYSVPLLFLCFCFASYCCTCVAVSVCVCLWEKTFAIEFLRPIAIHVSTCSGCIALLTSCFDIPQAWRKASVMCQHCSWQRLA